LGFLHLNFRILGFINFTLNEKVKILTISAIGRQYKTVLLKFVNRINSRANKLSIGFSSNFYTLVPDSIDYFYLFLDVFLVDLINKRLLRVIKFIKRRFHLVNFTGDFVLWMRLWGEKCFLGLTEIQICIYFILCIEHISFALKVECSFSEKHTPDQEFRKNKLKFLSIIELKCVSQLRVSFGIVQADINFNFSSAVKSVTSSNKIIWSNWRVMAELLNIKTASIYWHL